MNEISDPVEKPSQNTTMDIGTAAAELTQSLRRLDRAITSERVTQSMKLGKPAGETPLIRELGKAHLQLTNIMLAHGLEEEEMGGETNVDTEVTEREA